MINSVGIIEPVVSVLIHPSPASRLSASWCLGCIARALPSQLTPLLDRCVERMDKLKSSPEAVSGYSSAIASLLGGIYQCPLGIPHAKGKVSMISKHPELCKWFAIFKPNVLMFCVYKQNLLPQCR